jgi:hypothetical protein
MTSRRLKSSPVGIVFGTFVTIDDNLGLEISDWQRNLFLSSAWKSSFRGAIPRSLCGH